MELKFCGSVPTQHDVDVGRCHSMWRRSEVGSKGIGAEVRSAPMVVASNYQDYFVMFFLRIDLHNFGSVLNGAKLKIHIFK
jgi:hypothetical protein